MDKEEILELLDEGSKLILQIDISEFDRDLIKSLLDDIKDVVKQ